MNIIEYKALYPEPDNLTDNQRKCYSEIEQYLFNEKYIDVLNNESYIFLFLNQLLKGLLLGVDYKEIEKSILFIKANYLHATIQDYCTMWLGDLLVFAGEYRKALEAYSVGLNPSKIWTLVSTKVIELKLYLGVNLNAIEILTYKKNITKFGKNNLEDIVKYVENVISKDYELGLLNNSMFLTTEKDALITPALFSGSIYGYSINQIYKSKNNALKYVGIEKLKNFDDYVLSLTRRAENALREDMDMPRVGEGWISETQLFYKIKQYFINYTVIQHFNAEWLGKQHLDIFIKEIKVGVEYHGLQHFEPIDYFGGEEAFIENQKRDKKKYNKCIKQNVKLIVVKEGYDFDNLIKVIKNFI